MGPQKHFIKRHFRASKMALTKARLLKHDFPVHGLEKDREFPNLAFKTRGVQFLRGSALWRSFAPFCSLLGTCVCAPLSPFLLRSFACFCVRRGRNDCVWADKKQPSIGALGGLQTVFAGALGVSGSLNAKIGCCFVQTSLRNLQ